MQTHTEGERNQNEELKLRLGASKGGQKLVTCSLRFSEFVWYYISTVEESVHVQMSGCLYAWL